MVVTQKEMTKIQEVADRAIRQLIEFGCDAVRIYASAAIKGQQTISYTNGEGNIFAQEALARNWLTGRDAFYAAEAESPGMDEPPNPGDGPL